MRRAGENLNIPSLSVWLFGDPGIRQATSVVFFCDLSRPSTMIEGIRHAQLSR